MSKTYKTPGIILKRFDYQETDRVLTIYSKYYGKITCLAKGVRRVTSRKRGNIEPFTLANLFLLSRRGFDILTEADAVTSYPDISKQLKKTFWGWEMCELVDQLTPYEQENQQVFDLLKNYLKKLEKEKESSELIHQFKIRLLEILGFGVPVKKDIRSVNNHIEEIIEKRVNSDFLLKKLSINL